MKAVLYLAFACTACGQSVATYGQLRDRASFDLSCDKAKLEVVSLGDDVAGVRGCGQRATYVERCTGAQGNPERTCTWVMDSGKKQPPP
jgi:hypothetical protein